MCHMSRVTCHVSAVKCHMLRVKCHMSFSFSQKKMGQCGGASLWQVYYQRGLPCLVLMVACLHVCMYICIIVCLYVCMFECLKVCMRPYYQGHF